MILRTLPQRSRVPITLLSKPAKPIKKISLIAGGPGSGRHPEGAIQFPKVKTVEQAQDMGLHHTWKEHDNWQKQAYGGVLVNKKGEFLLREPTNHFDGYAWTFPKGKIDNAEEHPVTTALREVKEESGYDGHIVDHVPGNFVSGSGSNSNYYLMRAKNYEPHKLDNETQGLTWASYKNAKDLISQSKNVLGRQRDLKVLDAAQKRLGKYGTKDIASAALRFIEAYNLPVEIQAGGEGSGCHGPNCGRPAGSGGGAQEPVKIKQAGLNNVLGPKGWSKAPEKLRMVVPGNFGQKAKTYGSKVLLPTYTHPEHGALHVGANTFHYISKEGWHALYKANEFHDVLDQLQKGTHPASKYHTGVIQPSTPVLKPVASVLKPTPATPFDEPKRDTHEDVLKQHGFTLEQEFTGTGNKLYTNAQGTESVKVFPGGNWKYSYLTKIGVKEGHGAQALQEHLAGTKPSPTPAQTQTTQDKSTTGRTTGTLNPSSFTYVKSGAGLGGAFDKHIYKDKDGNQWMFKPAQTLGGGADPKKAYADQVAGKIQELLRPDNFVKAEAITMNVPGKGQVFGSIQKLVPDAGPLMSKNPYSMTTKETASFQKEQVVDWLLSNHDSHSGQFVQDSNGKVYGIDKTQMGKFFGKDELTPTYHPNTQEKPPLYNAILSAAKADSIDIDPQVVTSTIANAQAIPDDKFKDILKPYAQAAFSSKVAQDQYLDKMVERKNNLKSDFEKLYSNVTGTKVTLGAAPTPVAVPKKEYPAIPSEAIGKVSQGMHEHLNDLGYKFYNVGKTSGQAKYKDSQGKVVFVTDPKKDAWTYYPMGSGGASGNPHGSLSGEGLGKLKDAVTQPFEKPDAPVIPSTSNTPIVPSGITPALKEAWDNLPHGSPIASTTDKGELVVPGKQLQYVTKVKFTDEEKSSIDSYKGNGYHGINAFLWGSSDSNYHAMHVKNIDSALAKSKITEPLVVWRGLRGSYSTDMANYILGGGKEVTPLCYQSTGTSQEFAHDWGSGGKLVFQIHLPAGTPAHAFSSESEIMLDRHMKYTVNHSFKYNGKMYVDVSAHHDPSIGEEQVKQKFKKLGMSAAASKPMTSNQYAGYITAARQIGITSDDFERAMTLYTPVSGKDLTPVDVQVLRQRIQAQVERNKSK